MTLRALSIALRFHHAARFTLTSILLGASLLIAVPAPSAAATHHLRRHTASSLLTVALSGSGSVTSSPSGINCGTSCSASYASGTSVTLTATAATGYSFAGWGGACSGTNSSCAGSITAASNVTAAFSQNSVSNSTYIISWDPVTDPTVTGYKIYYATAPFSSATQIQSINLGTLTSYQFTASALGVSTGTTVYLAVTAVGGGMESPLSSPVSAVLQ